jgi:hypothetical protein
MIMLALELTLVPTFLLIVSMSGKWWGPSIAGWLAGLPVVASIIAAGAPFTRADLIGRMLAGALLTVLITAVSGYVGSKWSGLLAVFPLLGSVVVVRRLQYSHRR